jgi:hypothetical protein
MIVILLVIALYFFRFLEDKKDVDLYTEENARKAREWDRDCRRYRQSHGQDYIMPSGEW